MGFFRRLLGLDGKSKSRGGEIADLSELFNADGLEFQFRQAAFWGCVNLIANAIGKCEVREFRNNAAKKGPEWYLWNVQTNKNQSAAAFRHKMVSKAFAEGDALIVKEPYGEGLVVADSFEIDEERPVTVYRNITVGKRKIERLPEAEVLYIRPNWKNVEPLIRKMGDSFLRMMSTAMNNYLFNNGQHWKVHVDQISDGDDDWRKNFAAIIDKQIRPFFESKDGILPELDGYTYTQVGGGSGTVKSDEVRSLAKAIWTETGRGFLIPTALTGGDQQDVTVAKKQLLEDVVDPFAGVWEQEINRKRFTMGEYLAGSYMKVDTSAIAHFDIFANAANVEKIIGSGVKSINELRALIGDAPIPEEWADKHFMTLNIGSAEKENEEGGNET